MSKSDLSSKEMLDHLTRMRRNGRSYKTACIYLNEICTALRSSEDWYNHNLAVAEIMARIAPKGQSDAWYNTGLLYRVPDMWDIGYADQNRVVLGSLMTKAGFKQDAVSCVRQYRNYDETYGWNPITAALVFADTHVTEEGEIMTSETCCSFNDRNHPDNKGRCTMCMYAKYYLSKSGVLEACEERLSELKSEVDRKQKSGREA